MVLVLIGIHRAQAQDDDPLEELLAATSRELAKAGVDGRTLSSDRRAIEAAYPQIKKRLGRQMEDAEVLSAIASAWVVLRHPDRTVVDDETMTCRKYMDRGDSFDEDKKAKKDAKEYEKTEDGGKLSLGAGSFVILTESLGKLTVKSSPDGASVSVNGVDWGQTSVSKFERTGKYPIVIEKSGYKKHSGEATIVKGKPQTYEKKLEPASR